jgi:putative transposase
MEVSASAFYTWLKTPEDSEKAQRKSALEAKASEIFIGHRQTYGYRRLSDALHPKGIKARRA